MQAFFMRLPQLTHVSNSKKSRYFDLKAKMTIRFANCHTMGHRLVSIHHTLPAKCLLARK